MDTQTLTQAIRNINPSEFSWKFALYNAQKGRDGTDLEFRICKMDGISEWIEELNSNLLDKILPERTVAPYSPLAPKELICALDRSDDMIKEKITAIISDIENAFEHAPEDFISGAAPKPVGYAFYGARKDESGIVTDRALYMRRTNPFLAGQKAKLCMSGAEGIVESESPLLKFTLGVDFFMYGDGCYFFADNIEKDFEFESRHVAICAKRLEEIAQNDIVSDYEQLEKVALSNKHAKKFVDFDVEILDYIKRISIMDRMDFLTTYGITVDNSGRMESSDPEQCELIIDLLCCRSCLDAFGRLSVGNKITPR